MLKNQDVQDLQIPVLPSHQQLYTAMRTIIILDWLQAECGLHVKDHHSIHFAFARVALLIYLRLVHIAGAIVFVYLYRLSAVPIGRELRIP